jgi:hypothetical protein
MRQLVNGLLDANWLNNQTILAGVKNECPRKTRFNLPHQIVRMQTNSHPICIVSGTEFDCAKRTPRKQPQFVRSAPLCVQISRRRTMKYSGLQSNVKSAAADFEGLRVLATMGRARRHENTHRNSKSAHERTRAEDILLRGAKIPMVLGVCAGGIWDTPAQCTEVRQQLLSSGVIRTI